MADPDHMCAWQRIDAGLTTSGRIEPADVACLAGLGVRHVINLALDTHPEALADEAQVMAAHGLGYTQIPVPFDAPDDSHFAAFCAALVRAEHPLHVHCIMNWRVSAFLYRWHRDVQGMAEPQARALMERQWVPETNPHPDAAAWAAFIAGTGR